MAFRIIRNNIIHVAADAIVNTANPNPTYASGTDAAIYRAAGSRELLEERKKIGAIRPGDAKATPAFRLQAKYIIHTVGPAWQGGNCGEMEILRSCYEKSLLLAESLGCRSIAFPLIATGIYDFPKDKALMVAVSVFSEFLTEHEMDITLVVFDPASFVLSGRLFDGIDSYIDEHYVEKQSRKEYAYFSRREREDFRREEEYLSSNRPFRPGDTGSLPPPMKPKPFPTEQKERKERPEEDAFPEDLLPECRKDTEEADQAPEPPAGSASFSPVTESIRVPRSLDDLNTQTQETFQEMLLRLIREKGFTNADVYKRAQLDRKLFYKIKSNPDYHPKRNTAISLAIGLKLNLDETTDFLARAGYALSPCSRSDLIIAYFIANGEYDLVTINIGLFEKKEACITSF